MHGPEKFTKACAVFVSRTDDTVLVAAMWNHGGAFVDMDDGVAFCDAADFEAVGRVVMERLAACRFEPKFDHRGRKKSDWPAFRASKMKSMRAFEDRFVRLSVHGLHGETFYWEVMSPEFFNGSRLQTVVTPGSPSARGESLVELARFFVEVEKKTETP